MDLLPVARAGEQRLLRMDLAGHALELEPGYEAAKEQ